MRYVFLLLLFVTGMYRAYASGPVAINDTITIHENAQTSIDITPFVTNPAGGALNVSIAFPPFTGSATVIGTTVLYRAQPGFLGLDSFEYSACDTANRCATAEIYVVIQGNDLPPIVVTSIYTFTDTVTSLVLNVLAVDTDPDHDTLYVTSVTNTDTSIGSLSLDSATHNVIFTHNALTCGKATYNYMVCNFNRCDTGTVIITVNCPDSVSLPQGFSPNGDGKNDMLVFKGLEYFAPSIINIFDRNGTTVYQSNNYLNNWDGTDLNTHNALPDGTYFYVLTLPNGKIYNNYVIINR